MNIDSVDFFYLSMPVVTEAADGSQDALLVRVTAGGIRAGANARPRRCPRSPLSSRRCRTARAGRFRLRCSASGSTARTTSRACRRRIAYNSMDLLQAAHTWSGIEMALWDLLGRQRGVPAYRLLGYRKAYPKLPYASRPVRRHAGRDVGPRRRGRKAGFRAAKFGWAPFGKSLASDILHIDAAREGLGKASC